MGFATKSRDILWEQTVFLSSQCDHFFQTKKLFLMFFSWENHITFPKQLWNILKHFSYTIVNHAQERFGHTLCWCCELILEAYHKLMHSRQATPLNLLKFQSLRRKPPKSFLWEDLPFQNALSKNKWSALTGILPVIRWESCDHDCHTSPPRNEIHAIEPVIRTHFSSVQFSHSVVSDSLRPHESQHARPACPSPTLRVHPNPCPSSQWCHPAISSSVIPFSSCPQSLPASESFSMKLKNTEK